MQRLTKAEKEKRGTLDNRHREPLPGKPMDYIPSAPNWVSDRAKHVFSDIVTDLFARGLLYQADIDLIAAYSSTMAQFIELTELINHEGYVYEDKNGQKRKHPALIPQRSAYQAILSTAKTLGISPFFRDKVSGFSIDLEKGRKELLINEAVTENNLSEDEKRALTMAIDDKIGFLLENRDSGRSSLILELADSINEQIKLK